MGIAESERRELSSKQCEPGGRQTVPARNPIDPNLSYPDVRQPHSGVNTELLDVRAVAVLLGNCSTRHVRRLVDAGRMPHPIKLGSLLRWRRHELISWISSGCPAIRDGKGAQQ